MLEYFRHISLVNLFWSFSLFCILAGLIIYQRKTGSLFWQVPGLEASNKNSQHSVWIGIFKCIPSLELKIYSRCNSLLWNWNNAIYHTTTLLQIESSFSSFVNGLPTIPLRAVCVCVYLKDKPYCFSLSLFLEFCIEFASFTKLFSKLN